MIERKWPGGRRMEDWHIVMGLVAALGTVGGMAWALCSYPIQWSNNTLRLNKLEPEFLKFEERQTNDEAQMEVLRGDMRVIVAQYADIKEDLHYLRREKEK